MYWLNVEQRLNEEKALIFIFYSAYVMGILGHCLKEELSSFTDRSE